MDALIARFARLGAAANDGLSFYMRADGGTYCMEPIAAGTILGEIRGEPKYIWEIDHDMYVIVDKEYVLDVSRTRAGAAAAADILWIREENATMNAANCTVTSDVDEATGGARFFFQAVTDIPAHTELVYYVLSHMYI